MFKKKKNNLNVFASVIFSHEILLLSLLFFFLGNLVELSSLLPFVCFYDLNQCYEYCFCAHFSLSIGIKYFGTGLFWHTVSKLPFLYFFLFIILYTYISLYIIGQNPYNLLSFRTYFSLFYVCVCF